MASDAPAPPKAAHLEAGEAAERLALRFLQEQGLRLVQSNFRCKSGELDLIMRDGGVLVVVEVRRRRSNSHGGPLASITGGKQARIIAAAQQYVIMRRLTHLPLRFDVVTFTGDQPPHWIKDAFRTY